MPSRKNKFPAGAGRVRVLVPFAEVKAVLVVQGPVWRFVVCNKVSVSDPRQEIMTSPPRRAMLRPGRTPTDTAIA